MSGDPFIWIRVRLATVWAAIRALKDQSVRLHDEARLERPMDEKRAGELNAEGDHLDDMAEELRDKVNTPPDPEGKRDSDD
jgi:hypothetical protein